MKLGTDKKGLIIQIANMKSLEKELNNTWNIKQIKI
jgi:hypothetical protein